MEKNYPNHVAIILDGNRRWAKERGLPQLEGHKKGFDNICDLVPYIIGSATLMAVFNTYSKFAHEQRAVASKIGKKMALGVIFYGLFKNNSALIHPRECWNPQIHLPDKAADVPGTARTPL